MREWPDDEVTAGADVLSAALAGSQALADGNARACREAVTAVLDAVREARTARIKAEVAAWMAARRQVLAAHGIDPDMPARGVSGPVGQVVDGYGHLDPESGEPVRIKLRNHICVLDGVEINGHRTYDGDGPCVYCGAGLPGLD